MLTPSPTILPLRTMTAANGPPRPVTTFSVASAMARRRNSGLGVFGMRSGWSPAGIEKPDSVWHRANRSSRP